MSRTLSPQEFVMRWRSAQLKESAASQSHFIDLCHLLGQPTPVEDDPAGIRYTFEVGAQKMGGGGGFADVWKRGCFAWEYKGRHANLDAAYGQLLQYREALENPPLLIVSDMERIVVHTNFTNTIKRIEEFTLDDLLDPARLDLLRAAWTHPDRFRSAQTTEEVTREAAAHFAELAEHLRKYGEDPQAVARFLIRLLFCLFAEDVRLLPEGIFGRLVTGFRQRPPLFAQQLAQLFGAMAEGGVFALQDIPHIDGGLFDDATVLEMDTDGLEILAQVCGMDWSNIEPSILGTLFERGLDPDKRAQLGAHYTGRDDILLVVEPVLMAPLRRRWAEVQAQAEALAAERETLEGVRARANRTASIDALLSDFARDLADVRVLDPACGSGNFLYVGLKALLDLWKEVSMFAFGLGLPARYPLEGESPHPRQLHGIEVNPYAHELAQATIWIGYLQWLRENGFGFPAKPILKPLQTVIQQDAILGQNGEGSLYDPAWPAADIIIGNPPFLGSKRLRAELGDAYIDKLFVLYDDRVAHESDLVCYWFERARALIAGRQARRAGLLATQGIRGGASRRTLERIKESGDIFMAWADREWVQEGAAVHVSMVGFDDGSETERVLDGEAVEAIHADLTADIDLTTAQRLPENAGLAFMGTTKGGPFDLTPDVARTMLAAKGNPNGRPNSDVIKLWVNGSDITGRRRGMYIVDFGCDMPMDKAALYEAPFEHIQEHVRPMRAKNKRKAYRERWWILAEARPAMRAALEGLSRYIITPRIAKHHLMAWLPIAVVPDSATVAIAREDDYFLGVLQARPHTLWARRQGTQLESRPRYTATTCFETYPFPWPPGQELWDDPGVQAIAGAARDLVAQREAWLNPEGASAAELKKRTLTNLYNADPTWLQNAHRRLDAAVLAAYGWPPDLDDDAILRRLLALNQERAGG